VLNRMARKRSRSKIQRKRRRARRTRKLRGGAKKEFTFYNKHHYGDHILNLRFFYNHTPLLKEKGIKIHYLYDPNYVKNLEELRRYVDPDVVTLHTITPDSLKDATELWMETPVNDIHYTRFEPFFTEYYKKIANTLGLEGMNTSLYQKEDYLHEIYKNLPEPFKDLDILFINASPQSGQVKNYDAEKFNSLAKKLAGKYKLATTSPVDNSIPCSFREGLYLQDIGAISTHAKYIIGTNSGPMVTCYNDITKKNVKKFIIFEDKPIEMKEIPLVRFDHTYDITQLEKDIG